MIFLEEQAFKEMKALISEDVMLHFPDINKPFYLIADASDYQLGSTIIQDGKPITFYSRKLTPTQQLFHDRQYQSLIINK